MRGWTFLVAALAWTCLVERVLVVVGLQSGWQGMVAGLKDALVLILPLTLLSRALSSRGPAVSRTNAHSPGSAGSAGEKTWEHRFCATASDSAPIPDRPGCGSPGKVAPDQGAVPEGAPSAGSELAQPTTEPPPGAELPAHTILAAVLESIPDAVFIADREGRSIEFNNAYATFHRFPNKDACYRNLDEYPSLLEVFLPDGSLVPPGQWAVARALRGESGNQVEYGLRRKDTGESWIGSYNFAPIRDASGTLLGAVVVGREVTHRKWAEEARRENESRFRTLVESLPDAVFLHAGGRITYCNPACVRLFAASGLDQLLGKSPSELLQACDSALFYGRAGSPAVPSLPSQSREGEIFRIDGAPVPVLLTTLPMADDGTDALLVVLHDLTGQRAVERKLRDQELLVREAAELAQVGGWGFDPVTLESDWTPEVAKVYDLDPAHPPEVGKALSYFDPEDRPGLEAALEAAVRNGTPHDLELRLTTAAGNRRWVRSICRPSMEGGMVVRVRGSLQDITDRKRAEAEIRALNTQLEERVRERTAELEAANRELEAFSYSVSHVLRAPLRAVQGFTRILLSEYRSHLPEEAQDYLDEVLNGAVRMGRLVNELLGFSRLGRQPVRLQPVDTGEMVELCLAEVLRGCDRRRIETRVEPLPDCEADPGLLRQVWLNLLSNAVKYSSPKDPAAIEVGVLPAAGGPVFYVRDNGVGFEPQYAHKLFGVFQRLHRSEEFDGTGIGLALVQRIIHRHGGTVWAEGEPGQGAVFYFTLGTQVEPAGTVAPVPPAG